VTDATGGERVIARLRPHGRALVGPSVALVLLSGATTAGLGLVEADWQATAVAAVAGLLVLLLCVVPLLRWAGRRYVVTTRRVVVRRGVLVRSRQEVLHGRGYSVTVRRGALQALSRSGDVVLVAGGDRPVVLEDVPGARLLQATLQDLVERAAQDDAAARRAGTFPLG